MAAEIKKAISFKTVKSREDSFSKGKGALIVNKNKIGESSSNKQIFDSKQKSVVTDSKSEVKGKTVSSSSKTVAKTKTVKAKAVKKVYTLPGQKFDPPEEREPLRIFYESLSKQIPSSEMAEFWMMEHGLLSPERAKRAYERKQKRQQQLRMGTPIKSHKTEKPESSQKQQSSKNGEFKPKKRINYSDDENDYIIKHKKVRGMMAYIMAVNGCFLYGTRMVGLPEIFIGIKLDHKSCWGENYGHQFKDLHSSTVF